MTDRVWNRVEKEKIEKWEISKIVDGCAEVKMESWKHFFDFVREEMLEHNDYIWRGQSCRKWKLESTFDRLLAKAKIPTRQVGEMLNQHLSKFRYAVRGRRGTNPTDMESDNDWWALGQHYGLATPLLDWTGSPFVAAFFSFYEDDFDEDNKRAVYAISKSDIEGKSNELFIKANLKRTKELKKKTRMAKMLTPEIQKEVELIKPFSDENQRLVNQDGLFISVPVGKSLERWVQHNFKGEDETYVLMKIIIPSSIEDREEFLSALNRMNINHLTLFPDLEGSSKFCNISMEIDKY